MSVARSYIAEGHAVAVVLASVGLSRSRFYYQGRGARRGKAASTHTRSKDRGEVSNQQVVSEMKVLLQQEFVDYGYIKVTWWLRRRYVINFKKVYRLMKQERLLHKRRCPSKQRQWVEDYVPKPEKPYDYIETDIKYIHIDGARRMAYLLTAIDVYSRAVLAQQLHYSIRKQNVVELFTDVCQRYALPTRVFVRSDNGSQFAATLVREHLRQMNITQEFTRPATPQQNGHIEAYHSIVEHAVCQRFEFESLLHAQQVFQRFEHFYNHHRIHSGVAYAAPVEYLRQQGFDTSAFDKKTYVNLSDSTQVSIGNPSNESLLLTM